MTTLNLGVIDAPYSYGEGQTTVEVARILEDKYGLMGVFFKLHRKGISEELAKGVAKALRARIQSGSSAPADETFTAFGTAQAMAKTRTMFSDFISKQEAERAGIPGTPTAAALRGVNHRLKHPYAKANSRRPSFRDTGTYESHFQAWVTK